MHSWQEIGFALLPSRTKCHQSTSGWWFETPLKNISQLGRLFPIYGKIKNGNQTTNQTFYTWVPMPEIAITHPPLDHWTIFWGAMLTIPSRLGGLANGIVGNPAAISGHSAGPGASLASKWLCIHLGKYRKYGPPRVKHQPSEQYFCGILKSTLL